MILILTLLVLFLLVLEMIRKSPKKIQSNDRFHTPKPFTVLTL